jgi:hypothetical protein
MAFSPAECQSPIHEGYVSIFAEATARWSYTIERRLVRWQRRLLGL